MGSFHKIEGCTNSDLGSVKNFINSVKSELTDYIIDEDLFYDIRLILDELIINGAKHGNKCSKDKKVFLNVIMDNKEISIKVRDEGIGINYDPSAYKVEDMLCNGRGLLIVQSLADNVIMNKNEVTAVKYILD